MLASACLSGSNAAWQVKVKGDKMQGSLRCLSGRGAGGIVRRRARYSLPSLETQWLRSLARPARVERRQARQGCRRCSVLSEAQATKLDVRRLRPGSCPGSVLGTSVLHHRCHWAGGFQESPGPGAGPHGQEQRRSASRNSAQCCPRAVRDPVSASSALPHTKARQRLRTGVCVQVEAGLLCLVRPMHALPR